MKNLLVSDVMTRDPITVNPETNLLECAKKMVNKRVRGLLISEKGKLKGYVSRRDILWAIVKKSKDDLSKIKAIDISPKKIVTIKPEEKIEDAINKIKKSRYGRIPVVKGDKLLGILTMRDILTFTPEFFPEFEELVYIKDETEKLKRLKARSGEIVREGICEECGEKNTVFYKFNGMFVCEQCLSSM
tara:strand:+ start:966 stop:1529 length:564 start_codon:yes stop_codon:yes gene_type:complete